MNTTYFGREYGVMILFDAHSKQVLSVNEMEYATNVRYFEAVNKIKKYIKIQVVTCNLHTRKYHPFSLYGSFTKVSGCLKRSFA